MSGCGEREGETEREKNSLLFNEIPNVPVEQQAVVNPDRKKRKS